MLTLRSSHIWRSKSVLAAALLVQCVRWKWKQRQITAGPLFRQRRRISVSKQLHRVPLASLKLSQAAWPLCYLKVEPQDVSEYKAVIVLPVLSVSSVHCLLVVRKMKTPPIPRPPPPSGSVPTRPPVSLRLTWNNTVCVRHSVSDSAPCFSPPGSHGPAAGVVFARPVSQNTAVSSALLTRAGPRCEFTVKYRLGAPNEGFTPATSQKAYLCVIRGGFLAGRIITLEWVVAQQQVRCVVVLELFYTVVD